jgi:hypothetical protein
MNMEEMDKLAYVVVGDEKSENYYRRLRPEFLDQYFEAYGEEGFEVATTAYKGSVARSVVREEGTTRMGSFWQREDSMKVETVITDRDGDRRVSGSTASIGDYDKTIAIHRREIRSGIEDRIEAMATVGTTTALMEGAL